MIELNYAEIYKEYKKQSSIADYETGDAVFCSFSEIVIK